MNEEKEPHLDEAPCPRCEGGIALTGMSRFTDRIEYAFGCECGATGWVRWDREADDPERRVELVEAEASEEEGG